jgi:UDP-N-acetylmuramyl pentapeptide phosphotransferase/UDP-N-acetylglucosamine-1-phosphate transferase
VIDRAAVAFAVTGFAVVLLGAGFRTLARRQKRRWPRRSGGLILLVALPVGLLVARHVPDRAVVVALGAAALAAFGLLRDRVDVPRWVVGPTLVAVAAAVTVAGGLRFPVAGVPGVDEAWTVAWLVLVTLAFAGSGNADGQMPALAAATVLPMTALALFAFQGAAAMLLAAFLGGSLAFLAYNLRPASLYLGRTGASLLGFVVAAGALWVEPTLRRPGSLLVPVLLVGVVLVDGTVVVLSRLRRGRPLTVRIRDHLSHRLVASGLRPTTMILLLVVAQLAVGVVAVFVGRRVLAPGLGALVAAVVLAVVTGLALRARMRTEGRRPNGRIVLVLAGVVAFCVIATIPAAAAGLASESEMSRARFLASEAIRSARAGDTDRAAELFAQAEEGFAAADHRLSGVLTAPSLVVPVVGANVDAARRLARTGRDLAAAGLDLSQGVTTEQLRVVDGRVPLDTVASVEPRLSGAARTLRRSNRTIDRVRPTYLIPKIEQTVVKLRDELRSAARDAERAAVTAQVAPLVLGQDAPRHYLLLVQNPAELRGTGGLIGNWGVISAQNGTLHLDRMERTASLNALIAAKAPELHAPADYVDRYGRFQPTKAFQNVNISPDFPTVAAVAADLYTQASGQTVDGVLAVDPYGLAALLRLTGPVRVADWNVPITADNVVDVTLRDAYAAYARTPDRADFLGDVARQAVDRATSGDLAGVAQISRVLGQAAHEGHLLLWFADPTAERIVQEIGVGGGITDVTGDSLHVSATNAGANKLDYYLERTVRYALTLTPQPDWRTADAVGTIAVVLANGVPPSGLPQIVAGPYEGLTNTFVYGQNHVYQSVYTPLAATGVRVDGAAGGVEGGRELGRNVYSAYTDVFAQQTTDLTLDVAGTVPLRDGGWYDLTIQRQPTVHPDRVEVRIAVPDGYRIIDARGLTIEDGAAVGTIDLTRTTTVRVRLGAAPGNLWDRLRSGSG